MNHYYPENQIYSNEDYRNSKKQPILGFFQCDYSFNQDNIITINNFIDNLFDNYSKVLPVRVDLELQKNHCKEYNYEEIRALFTRLQSNLRHNQMFEHYISYIAKLEYAHLTGWHYHVYFFFDGHYVQDDYRYADFICQYWRNVITKNKGRAFSSNMQNREHHDDWKAEIQTFSPLRNALGKVIDWKDHEFIFKLRQSAYYLAKETSEHLAAKHQYARHLRFFNVGQIPVKSARGRKRKVYVQNPEASRQIAHLRENGIIQSKRRW